MFDVNTRILIVDSMPTMRKLVQKSCESIGFKDFSEASDGGQAWETLNASPTPVGLVLSDWNFPNGSGIDLLKRIRADSRYKPLPFIFITGETSKEHVLSAIQAGVNGYLVKPVSAEQIQQRLNDISAKMKR